MKRTIEYIEKMVCHGESVPVEMLHKRDRREPFNTARQLIMTLALEQAHTMSSAGAYFERDHATALNARRSIHNRVATDKVFREKYEGYKEMLRDKETFKVAYLSNELARLRREATELQHQINSIAI